MASHLTSCSLKHFSKLTFTVKRGSNYSLDDFSKWLRDFDHLMTAILHSLTVIIINYAVSVLCVKFCVTVLQLDTNLIGMRSHRQMIFHFINVKFFDPHPLSSLSIKVVILNYIC